MIKVVLIVFGIVAVLVGAWYVHALWRALHP